MPQIHLYTHIHTHTPKNIYTHTPLMFSKVALVRLLLYSETKHFQSLGK